MFAIIRMIKNEFNFSSLKLIELCRFKVKQIEKHPVLILVLIFPKIILKS